MLSRRYKLPVAKFTRQPAHSRSGQYLFLKKHPNNLEFSRFGVIISTRFDKRAVYRNQLKRLIFDFFQSNLNKISLGYDYLVIIKPASAKNKPTSLDLILKDLKLILNL